ncbi:MAG: NUDIX domain-containing protein [Erysipelotrichaceae bacterium]|nr:NUDIX domain-containing protein [Erysipelotrichaceae bacterium]
MNYEFSCGAVLYRRNRDQIEYLLVRDRHRNYSFPKGHMNKGEKSLECAVREVREEVGVKIDPDPWFAYLISYPLNEDTEKDVTYYLADIAEQEPFINDGEIREILFLPYEQAYEKITFDQLKEILAEVNDYLVKGMKVCCMFEDEDRFDKRNLELIRSYGSSCNGHRLYTWDEGSRTLYRCEKCGGYVLEQYSEIHMPDSAYIDYYPVRDEVHAEEINRKYDGWSIEARYPFKKIFFTYNY